MPATVMLGATRELCAAALIAAAVCAGCGSDSSSPTGPPNPPSTAVFGVFPQTLLIAAGDRGWLIALAAPTSAAEPEDVTARTRWESTAPAVFSAQAGIVTALAPGEGDVRATYAQFSAVTRVTVFSPADIRTFSIPATLVCWPNETFSWSAQAVLNTGAIVQPTNITWTSLDERIVSLTPVETRVSTGNVGTDAAVTCRSAGTTRFEARYAGRTAAADVTVRPPRDLLQTRGTSIAGSSSGTVTHGVTVFYLLDSAPAARIDFVSRDANDRTRVFGASSLPVTRGGGIVHLSNTFSWSGSTASLCEVVELVIPGSPPLRSTGIGCP